MPTADGPIAQCKVYENQINEMQNLIKFYERKITAMAEGGMGGLEVRWRTGCTEPGQRTRICTGIHLVTSKPFVRVRRLWLAPTARVPMTGCWRSSGTTTRCTC